MNRATNIIHAGRGKRVTQGAVNPVVQRASSLTFESVSALKEAAKHNKEQALFYGRRGTLTHFALQDAMRELEGGVGCYLFPCGAAAIANTISAFVAAGDHILVSGACYEPTQVFCNEVLSSYQVETDYFDPLIGAGIGAMIKDNTKVLFLESPSSLTMEVPDIPTMVKTARAINPDIVIMIDNTWAAGVFFDALAHDIDISIQAGTKYLVGHSDAMIGTAVCNARCWPKLQNHAYLMGQMVDADTAYTTARGLRTLMVRLKQHEKSSIEVAKWLATRPEVKTVNHPALPSCPGHEFYERDFSGCCGLFSFELNERLTEDRLSAFIDEFKLFSMAFSWGGYESLVTFTQPETLAKIRPNIKRKATGTLIRLHIGLEDPQDLIADLEAGFSRLTC